MIGRFSLVLRVALYESMIKNHFICSSNVKHFPFSRYLGARKIRTVAAIGSCPSYLNQIQISGLIIYRFLLRKKKCCTKTTASLYLKFSWFKYLAQTLNFLPSLLPKSNRLVKVKFFKDQNVKSFLLVRLMRF